MIKRLLLLAALLIARYHFDTLTTWTAAMLEPVADMEVEFYESSHKVNHRYLYPVMQHIRAVFSMGRADSETPASPTSQSQADRSTVLAPENRSHAWEKENQQLPDQLNRHVQHVEEMGDSRHRLDERMISRHQAMTIR